MHRKIKFLAEALLFSLCAIVACAEDVSGKNAEEKSTVPVEKEKTFDELKVAAESGDSQALYELGKAYHNGVGVAADTEKAFYSYKKSAEAGNANGQNALGSCYLIGFSVEKDLAKAEFWYKKSAEQGNTNAMASLAKLYYLKQDFETMHFYLNKAADKNNVDAICMLGIFTINGIGTPRDVKKAEAYFRRIEANNEEARNALDKMFRAGMIKEGAKITETPAQKLQRLKKLFDEKRDFDAAIALGEMYRTGADGVPVDLKKSLSYYKAVEKYSTKAKFALGMIYDSGLGVPVDHKKAVEYFESAAEFECPESLYVLASKYLSGRDVPRDLEKAIRCLQRSANGGSNLARGQLGLIYVAHLFGISGKEEIGLKLLQDAAEKLDPLSIAVLVVVKNQYFPPEQIKQARDYLEAVAKDPNDITYSIKAGALLNGLLGYPKDVPLAVEMIEKSVDATFESNNAQILGEIYQDGLDSVPADTVKAAKYLKLAADAGNRVAQEQLGWKYYYGNGVDKNLAEAKKYLSLAAAQGSDYAKSFLLEIEKSEGK